MSPLPRNTEELPVSVLIKVSAFRRMHKHSFTYRDCPRKSIVGEATQFLKEAHCCCLAYMGVHIEVVQDIKCECCFWRCGGGRKQAFTKKLDVLFCCTMTCAPIDVVLENSWAVHNDNRLTLYHNEYQIICAGLHIIFIEMIFPKVHAITIAWARKSMMANMKGETKFKKGGFCEAFAIPKLDSMEWGRPMHFQSTGFAENKTVKAVNTLDRWVSCTAIWTVGI